MSFEIFKAELKRIMEFNDSFDEEYFHDWYIHFKNSIYLDERGFAIFWFADVSFKTHDYQLIKQTKMKLSKKDLKDLKRRIK